ncbi:phosphoglycerate mutase-like protein [Cryphonectria parasitica EP155]|uniref:Phosphoglycerate mutase-like protein n=1 Tax=Cryphonectria parasitica (strain ATCC 38755 / EP155) TaxID=660469 RepID=A0A9P4XU87_CRYP1|nr:phosphoglycerate mutase-like protein [Cryphonectria parasitica EP155]KAF3760973.1 phosphoglycerate mutase-like protein [Cryphonectria parasitica EP155]
MPPTLLLIRHAEALHNVNQDYTIRDPGLSDLGRAQCAELSQVLQEKLPEDLKSNIGLIICSAMRRTCETAMLSLGWLIERGVPIQAHAGWQENSAKPCDTGLPVSVVAAEFPKIDFSHVDPVYPDKVSPAGAKYKYKKENLLARAQSDLEELYHRPEKVIVVVSHSGFMRQAVTGDHYFNADFRVYDFAERAPAEEGGPLKLTQSELTKGAGGMGRSWDEIVELGIGLPDEELPPGADVELPPNVKPN